MNSGIWCLIIILIIVIILIALFFAFRRGACYNEYSYYDRFKGSLHKKSNKFSVNFQLNPPRLFNVPGINGQSSCWDLYMIIYDLYLLYWNLAYGTSSYSANYNEFKANTLAAINANMSTITNILNSSNVCANLISAGIQYLSSTYPKQYQSFEHFKQYAIDGLNGQNNASSTQIVEISQQLQQCKTSMIDLIYQTVFISQSAGGQNNNLAANGQNLESLIPQINKFYADMLQCFNIYYTSNNLPDEFFNIIYKNYTNTNPNNPNSDPYAIPLKQYIITPSSSASAKISKAKN